MIIALSYRNSACFATQNRHYCVVKQALLLCKIGTIATLWYSVDYVRKRFM